MTKYAKIEAAPIPERYARGWYCLGKSDEFSKAPVALNYFGTRLVAYRGEDDRLIVLDGYCPHMGADLSLGYVEGNSLRCAMHSWRWGKDGVCDEIPYAKKIPPRACIKSWPTMDRNGLALFYYDVEDHPPIEEQKPPVIEHYGSEEWSDWVIKHMEIQTNARELVDNMADKAHFGPVHAAEGYDYKNTFHKHICVQDMYGKGPRYTMGATLHITATYYGPAYMITELSGELGGIPVESLLLVSHVPTSTESFDLRFGVMVKLIPGMSRDPADPMLQIYIKQTQDGFLEDVKHWHTKQRVDNPILCDGDGPIRVLREWLNQFYVDVADVSKTWDEPKVFSVDSLNPIPPQKLAIDEAAVASRMDATITEDA